jgi:hypothetical protein
MKVGDKIRCIDNDRCQDLEKGKIYTVLDIDCGGNPGVCKHIISMNIYPPCRCIRKKTVGMQYR